MVPACVIVTICPAIISVVVRGLVSTCGSAITSMTVVPDPLVAESRVQINASVLTPQSHVVVNLSCFVPPLTGNESDLESRPYRQLWTPAGVLVRRTPDTVSG